MVSLVFMNMDTTNTTRYSCTQCLYLSIRPSVCGTEQCCYSYHPTIAIFIVEHKKKGYNEGYPISNSILGSNPRVCRTGAMNRQ